MSEAYPIAREQDVDVVLKIMSTILEEREIRAGCTFHLSICLLHPCSLRTYTPDVAAVEIPGAIDVRRRSEITRNATLNARTRA